MRTKIASIHFKASDSLKDFTEKEVLRLEKLTDDILGCDVEFTYTKTNKEARVHVNVNGTVLHASETSDDFHKSIALAVDKLEQQIKKLKGKQLAKRSTEE
ncbi:ribosome-associated translation inhibitor RaiA [bacterium]|nr:ribosome-associated translation inhibitor RaiA [bacterium]MBU1985568.1 ribosome-associated translation inhibitor RaiA [bacterium]